MTFNSLKQLFTARRRTEGGNPISTLWVGDQDKSTLINPESGKVHAYIYHDGYGKYYPSVTVSPWRAVDLIRRGGDLTSLLSLPRCTVEMPLKRSMVEAQEIAEYALGLSELAD